MSSSPKKTGCWILTAVLLVAFGLPAFLIWNFMLGPVMAVNAQFKDLLGKPKPEVIAQLGPPKFTENPEEVKKNGIDYPWRNMGFEPVPDRPVHKEVLLYQPRSSSSNGSPFGVYIFIGVDDRVEAVDFAGT